MGRLVALLILASAARAHAEKPVLVALTPADDARRAWAVGPAGQVYEPDGKGVWVRRQAGGVSVDLVAATTAGGTVIAGGSGTAPFRLKQGTWTAVHLGKRTRARLGAGTRAVVAVGKSVFDLDKDAPAKVAEAPAPIVALAASQGGIVIATDRGLHRLQGGAFRPLPKAPRQVRALVSDRWALVERGALDLASMRLIAWPEGIDVAHGAAAGADLFAIGTHGAGIELLVIKGGKVQREPIPLDATAQVVDVVADALGRVAVATSDGRIALRDGGAWTVTEVREELPDPRPGPAPAESR